MRSTFTIGQVAKATGINAKTIRYYEEAGWPRHRNGANLGTGCTPRRMCGDSISSGGLGPWI